MASGEVVHHAFYGRRGVGKTVLLSDFAHWAADDNGWHVVRHRLSADQQISVSLVDRLADPARAMSRRWDRLVESLRANLTVEVAGPVSISKQFDATHTTGPGDTLLERALIRLGQDAASADTAVLLLLDEIHTPRPGPELVRLSNALQAIQEQALPVHVLAAGLRPPVTGDIHGAAFLERLGSTTLGLLQPGDTRLALLEPWARRGITVDPATLDRLVTSAGGYPYFIQLLGAATHESWADAGATGPITPDFADQGLHEASGTIASMYQGRYDRLSAEARRFVQAMASVGSDQPVSIAAIAQQLQRKVTSLSTMRATLIDSHQLIEPVTRGFVQFTLPWYGRWLTDSDSTLSHEQPELPTRTTQPGREQSGDTPSQSLPPP